MTTTSKSATYILQLLASEQQCYCDHYFVVLSFSSFYITSSASALNNTIDISTQLQISNTSTIHSKRNEKKNDNTIMAVTFNFNNANTP